MKKMKIKNIRKQIICIIIVLMLCNFIIPNITYAASDEDSGTIFAPVSKFITFLCDSIMQFLQNSFISTEKIQQEEGGFYFQFSPAIIFSGEVPAFDINFIDPGPGKVGTNTVSTYMMLTAALNENGANKISEKNYSLSDEDTVISDLKASVQDEQNKEIDVVSLGGNLTSSNSEYKLVETGGKFAKETITESLKSAFYNADKTKIYVIVKQSIITQNDNNNAGNGSSYPSNPNAGINNSNGGISTKYKVMLYEISSIKNLKKATKITDTVIDIVTGSKEYKSLAGTLQNIIATWYKAFRRIALVGLLSVLVYIGIQIILTTTSGKENSKYKKMLIDWLIALCLLFILHYIMNFVIVISKQISSILNTGKTDNLLNTLRNNIESGKTWEEVVTQVIMYVVITIYTIMFSFQYLKRVLYMAFFTIIAPMVTLTYPLDKIKDSKAQAFSMWIREYIFNALIQVVHLVVYYTLVGSALSLVENYPLYGIIAIGFITQAERIIRKMFGFDNATTVGTMGAAATGGLVVAAMNKMKSISSNANKTSESSASSSNNIRTVSNSGTSKGGAGSANGNIANGVKSVAGAYTAPVVKGVSKAVLGGALGATGAVAGFAAGVAQGDVSAALTGAVAGGKAGAGLGNAGVNLVEKTPGKVKNTIDEVRDTWDKGANGK